MSVKNNEKFRASLSEYSYLVYEKFLHKVFMDIDFDVPQRQQIMLYCFLHKSISTQQLSVLYGGSRLKVKSTYMIVKRLRDSDYLIKYDEIKDTGKTNTTEPIYVITAAGVKFCKELILSLFPQMMPEEMFSYSDYSFTLEEIIEYLSNRSNTDIPVYIDHYLGTRNVNTYLLSHPFCEQTFRYETEVGIAESGTTVSLFTRSLLGINNTYQIRCDALLKYYLPEMDDYVRFFIELDTGTQRSAILKEKIQGYVDNYLDTNSFSPNDSLLFCLQTKVNESHRELKKLKSNVGSKDYYYLMMLEFGCNMMSSVLPEEQGLKTVGEAIQYLDRLNNYGRLGSTDKSVYNYFKDTAAIDMSTPLSELKNNFGASRDRLNNKRKHVLNKLHMHSYYTRRNLLHRCANSISELSYYFLKGFSLYSAPDYNLDSTVPYLLPEMFDFRSKLTNLFASFNLVSKTSPLSYRLLYRIGKENKDGFVLKNSYYFMKERLHVIVENISDDLGGLYRINHLLNQPSIPSSLISSKIICLVDDTSKDKIKNMYVSSPLGKYLMKNDGSRTNQSKFEILFITYESVKTYGSFFTYDLDGNVVYKPN